MIKIFSILYLILFFSFFTFKVNSQECPTDYKKLIIDNIPLCHKGPTTVTSSLCSSVSGVLNYKGVIGLCPSGFGSSSTSGSIGIINNKVQYSSCLTGGTPVYFGQFGESCGAGNTFLEKKDITFNQTHRYFVFSTCNGLTKSVVGELSNVENFSQYTKSLCESGGGITPELTGVFDYGEIVCPNGYNGYPNCVDIDECSLGTSGCQQDCKNTMGSFTCSCSQGYKVSSTDPKKCDDINECTSGTSGCASGCVNTIGSYYCTCNQGYKLGSDNKTCVDIDECAANMCGTDDKIICTNGPGTFDCFCEIGYIYHEATKSCLDINECAVNNGGCSNECENKPGGYECKCPDGYYLEDGKNCKDIDECSTIPNICNDNSKQCVNKEGTYSCIQFHSISSVTPSTTKGGIASFKGKFGDIHNNASISIGDIGNCELINITSTLLYCTAPPGDGIHSINFTQNGLSFIGKNMYNYQVEVKKCLNDCTSPSNGQCNTVTGECKCNIGYTDFDCSIKIENEDNNNQQPPKTNVTVDSDTGGSNLNNQQTNFEIYFKTLTELDFNGNQVKSYSLKNNWSLNKTDSNIFSFSQFLNGSSNDQQQLNCEIKSIVEEIVQDKQYTFADTTFTIKSGMVKFTIIISNYTYTSYLNTLRLDLISLVSELDDTDKDNCNLKETEIDTSNINDKSTFNYIKISKNNKILSGRFINLLVSDGRPTYYSTTSVINETDSSAIVSLHLPHFTEDLMIDPDFSVLVSPNFKSSCNESNNRKWVIPVAVVVPVVCVAALTIVTIIIIKRKKTEIKVGIAQLKNLKN